MQRSIYETFLEKMVARARKNVAGDPFADDSFLGPQISAQQHARIMGMIDKARAQGAVCATGGGSPQGWFVEPTIFRDVTQLMDVMQEEVFGPVLAVAPFDDIDDVLRKAHDTCYGLVAGVFTANIRQGLRMARELEAGTVWVNCYGMISEALPFGGYRQSGNGKDLGKAAIDGFTQLKTVRFKI